MEKTPPKKTSQRIVFLLVDGVSSSTFETLIDAGHLPTMARLKKEGTYHGNVVSSFPTVSGPAHVPLLYGISPTSIDLIGHNQFIRKTGKLENYLLHYKQLDARLAGRKSLYSAFSNSVSVAEPARAGATAYRKNLFLLADWAKIFGPSNNYVLHTVNREYRRGRDLIVAWLHETDGFAHRSKRKEYITKSLERLDRWLATFLQSADQSTTVVLTSDHGMQWTDGKPFAMRPALKDAGLKRGEYRFYLDGGAFCQLYLKRDGSFARRQAETSLDGLPEKLARHPELDLILYRRQSAGVATGSGLTAVIQSARGRATVTKTAREYRYTVERGQDPLGYGQTFTTGLSARECVSATASSRYPDGHFQIYELLAAPSSGDVIITAADGKSLNTLTKYGVHGGLQRSQSVTFILSNAKLAATQPCLRTSDLPRLLGVLDSSDYVTR
ncbi:MAG: alkaline phosphatase family protein [Candidatus Andersenbacteria bacterium]